MITLNLLPIKEGLKYRKQLKHLMLFSIVIILIFIANIVFYSHHSDLVQQQQLKVNKLQKDVNKYTSLLGNLKKEKKKRVVFLKRIKAINSLEKLRKDLLKMLDEINRQIPHKTWLVSLNKKGLKLELEGGASSYENATRFANSLKGQTNTFSKVETVETHLENYSGKVNSGKYKQKLKYFAFKIDCLLK